MIVKFFLIVWLGELALLAAFLLIPDRGRWKRPAAGVLLAAALFFCGAVGFFILREKFFSMPRHREACDRAAQLIREGRRDALAEALRRDWYAEYHGRSLDQITQAFSDAVRKAEGEGGR